MSDFTTDHLIIKGILLRLKVNYRIYRNFIIFNNKRYYSKVVFCAIFSIVVEQRVKDRSILF